MVLTVPQALALLRLLQVPTNFADVESAFRRQSARCHPDKPWGSHEAFQQLTKARDVIVKAVERRLEKSEEATSKARSTFPKALCWREACAKLLVHLSTCLGCANLPGARSFQAMLALPVRRTGLELRLVHLYAFRSGFLSQTRVLMD